MSRSKWKGSNIDSKYIKKKSEIKKQQINSVMPRNSEIMPNFLGLTFNVHNGKNYVEVAITEDMIGHKFGEFSLTRGKFSFKKKKSKK